METSFNFLHLFFLLITRFIVYVSQNIHVSWGMPIFPIFYCVYGVKRYPLYLAHTYQHISSLIDTNRHIFRYTLDFFFVMMTSLFQIEQSFSKPWGWCKLVLHMSWMKHITIFGTLFVVNLIQLNIYYIFSISNCVICKFI